MMPSLADEVCADYGDRQLQNRFLFGNMQFISSFSLAELSSTVSLEQGLRRHAQMLMQQVQLKLPFSGVDNNTCLADKC